jgi:hypothetical protein
MTGSRTVDSLTKMERLFRYMNYKDFITCVLHNPWLTIHATQGLSLVCKMIISVIWAVHHAACQIQWPVAVYVIVTTIIFICENNVP